MMDFKKLEKLKQKLDSFRPLPPEVVANLHEDIVLRWTYNPNAIEGNTLTFENKNRKRYFDAIKRFLEGYRRDFLLVSGPKGTGKTRLVKEAFLKAEGRVISESKEEMPRKTISVWVDLSTLEIHAPLVEVVDDNDNDQENKSEEKENEISSEINIRISEKNNIPEKSTIGNKFKLKRKHFNITDKSTLIAIIQATVRRFSPHVFFRYKGAGLRTQLGFRKFYFSLPRSSQKIFISKPYLMGILLFGMFLTVCYSPLFFLYYTSHVPHLSFYQAPSIFKWLVQNGYFMDLMVSFFSVVSVFFISWFLLRWHEMFLIRRRFNRLYLMSFSDKYEKSWEKSSSLLNKIENAASLLPRSLPFNLSGKFLLEKKIKEFGNIYSDVPNLLDQLKIFLFQLHRIGLEPILVIDELDKLGTATKLIRTLDHDRKNWVWDHQIQQLASNWQENNGLMIFFDILLRFKESLGKHFPIVLIGDINTKRFMEFSKLNNLAYHTLIKETVLIGQIKVEAWGKVLSHLLGVIPPETEKKETERKSCSDRDKCPMANGGGICCCENFELDDEDGTLSCDGKVCQNFTKWRDYLWLQGMGCYGELLSLARTYRQSDWKEDDDTLKWASDVVPYFKKHMFGAGQISGQNLPDEYSQSFRNIETNSFSFGIVYNLIQREPVFLPVVSNHASSFIKAIHGTVWEFIESLEDNGWVEREKIKKNTYRSLGLKASDEAASYIKFSRVDGRKEE